MNAYQSAKKRPHFTLYTSALSLVVQSLNVH